MPNYYCHMFIILYTTSILHHHNNASCSDIAIRKAENTKKKKVPVKGTLKYIDQIVLGVEKFIY